METEKLNFNTMIAAQEDGKLHADLTSEVREIVQTLKLLAEASGGTYSAALSLNLSFKLDGGAIEVKAETKKTMPKARRSRTIYWATDDNSLTRKNPAQIDMPFRDVNAPKVRDLVDPKTGEVHEIAATA
jgi:hypothetical protein